MPRRKSFSSVIKKAARESERARKRAIADQKRREREREKAIKQAEEEAKLRYIDQRFSEVEDINTQINEWIGCLSGILSHTLDIDDAIAFDDLRIYEEFPKIQIPKDLTQQNKPPAIRKPSSPPTWLSDLLPCLKERYLKAVKKANLRYQSQKKEYLLAEKNRRSRLEDYQKGYEAKRLAFVENVKQRNQEIDNLEIAYQERQIEAIIIYNSMVLERSEYPCIEDYPLIEKNIDQVFVFPQEFEIDYVEQSKVLSVEYELPTVDVVPKVAEAKYVKSKDTITQKARRKTDIKGIYQDVISAIALRTAHEIFEADTVHSIDTVVFNGYVHTIDRATGKHVKPNIMLLRVRKDDFSQLELSQVENSECLLNLGGKISLKTVGS